MSLRSGKRPKYTGETDAVTVKTCKFHPTHIGNLAHSSMLILHNQCHCRYLFPHHLGGHLWPEFIWSSQLNTVATRMGQKPGFLPWLNHLWCSKAFPPLFSAQIRNVVEHSLHLRERLQVQQAGNLNTKDKTACLTGTALNIHSDHQWCSVAAVCKNSPSQFWQHRSNLPPLLLRRSMASSAQEHHYQQILLQVARLLQLYKMLVRWCL